MAHMADERARILVKVSILYYVEGLNQQEIAERLGISRPQVSRMLSAARAEGIVNISIKNPYAEEQEFENAIAETFGIRNVLVVDADGADPNTVKMLLAREGAALLESVLKDHDVVGVMASRTISAVSSELEYFSRKDLGFVPLVGGWGSEGVNWHASSNARVLGEKLKSRYWILNAPGVVGSATAREVLLREPEIREVLDLARSASVALVGIGQVSDEATVVQSGFLDVQDIEEVKRNGAVANICASFLDNNGMPIGFSASSRMISLTLQELRHIPQVIAIAGGQDKVQAITATLRGRWIDVLVTDLNTARAVLEWHVSHPLT